MKKTIYTWLLLLSSLYLSAQQVGEFSFYNPARNSSNVAQVGSKIYGVSEGFLFCYDQEDESIQTYSTINGLSDNHIVSLSTDPSGSLLVCYDNSNIDIIDKNGITNIFDLKQKISPLDKTINKSICYNQKGYLSTGLGVVVVNLQKYEIEDTYTLKKNGLVLKVNSCLIKDLYIYAATDSGIYQGKLVDNLVDHSKWKQLSNKQAFELAMLNNQLIYNSIIRKYKDGNGNMVHQIGILTLGNNEPLIDFHIDPNIGHGNIINQNNKALIMAPSTLWIGEGDRLDRLDFPQYNPLKDALLEKDGSLWLAGFQNGLSKYNAKMELEIANLIPEGPKSKINYHIVVNSKDQLYAVSGGRWDNRYSVKSKETKPAFIMKYSDYQWTNYSTKEIMMPGYISFEYTNLFLDPTSIAIDPKDPTHYFVSSWGDGVYEFKNDKSYKQYNQSNSTLLSIFKGDPFYIRVDGLIFDKKGNLWVANSPDNTVGSASYVTKQVHIMTPDEKWYSYHYPPLESKSQIKFEIQDKNGKMWATSPSDGILFILDNKGTLDDATDDQYRYFSSVQKIIDQDGKAVDASTYICLKEDLEGQIWIGTDKGVLVVQNSLKVFESNFYCTRIKVPRKELEDDGTQLADYLMASEQINSIVVDGANRKWMGTENNGIYLISANGLETIHHFNTENSPLTSNRILSLALDSKGVLYIGTDNGLISYKTDASTGFNKLESSNIYTYPNPVRPDYQGPITITGLRKDTYVKITDISGNIVTQGYSTGGQFVWNGKDSNSQRVSTGVYIAMCSHNKDNNSESASTRILFIQ